MPISEQKLIKLQLLITREKYGVILKDAIEIWKQQGIRPAKQVLGILGLLVPRTLDDTNRKSDDFLYKLIPDDFSNPTNSCCCLIGGAMVGKKGNGIYDVMEKTYNISKNEVNSLEDGFDNVKHKNMKYCEDAYLFSKEISDILFGD